MPLSDSVYPRKQDGAVYKIPCECGKVCIGETGRWKESWRGTRGDASLRPPRAHYAIFDYWVPSGNLCGGESLKSRNIDNFCTQKDLMMILTSLNWRQNPLQSATEWERQLTTARANQRTGLTNDRVTNCAPEVEFSPFRALSCPQLTFPSCC